MGLDIRTLTVMNLVGDVVSLIAFGVVWTLYRQRYRGLGFWFSNVALQTCGLFLIVLRGVFPDFVSMVVANVAVQAGVWVLLLGLERFWGRPGRHLPNLVVLGAFSVAFTWWSVVDPNLNHRDMLLSVTMSWFVGQSAWLLLVRIPGYQRPMARMAAVVLLCLVGVNLARATVLWAHPQAATDFFHAGAVSALALLIYATLNLLLTISLALMVTRRLLDEVRLQEEKFAKAFHSSPYAILITRASDGTILELNAGFEEITGFDRGEVLGKTTAELLIWASDESRTEFVNRVVAEARVRNVEMPFRRKSGEPLVGLVSTELLTIGQDRCLISSIGDVTEPTLLRQKLQELATHDALTGLPNRRLFTDRFQVALSHAQRKAGRLAVMSLDLDRFKEVNDHWGHEVGDAVLVEAARRLTSCLRKGDTVARFGGDEFVLLLWEVDSPTAAAQIARKILEQLAVPFVALGHPMVLQASLGISMYPEDGTDFTGLIRVSDEALYGAKNHGRNDFRFREGVKP